MRTRASTKLSSGVAIGLGAIVLASCTSKSNDAPDAAVTCNPAGGEVSGPPDTHCAIDGGLFVQSTDMAACSNCSGDGGYYSTEDAGPDAGCWAAEGYGPPSYGKATNTQGCKYAVSWTSTTICENAPVYFTVTGKHLSDGTPVTGASVEPDVTLDCDHAISKAPGPTAEGPPGTYKVGPIVFDKPGRWIARFHFYPDCCDLVPESLHDHAAFWIDVP